MEALKFPPGISPDFKVLLNAERSVTIASRLYQFHPSVVPGLLQAPGYAEAMFRAFGLAGQTLDEMLCLRLELQRWMLASDAQYEFVLDESALLRLLGGYGVMAAQMHHLAWLSEQPNITLQVLPHLAGPYLGCSDEYTLVATGDKWNCVFREDVAGDRCEVNAGDFAEYLAAFRAAQLLALSPTVSRALIRHRADKWASV